MGKCRAGTFKTNEVVTHDALVCHGGFGQPPCEYLDQCVRDNAEPPADEFELLEQLTEQMDSGPKVIDLRNSSMFKTQPDGRRIAEYPPVVVFELDDKVIIDNPLR